LQKIRQIKNHKIEQPDKFIEKFINRPKGFVLDVWKRSKAMTTLSGNPACINCVGYKRCRGGCRARSLWEYGDMNVVDPLCPLMKK